MKFVKLLNWGCLSSSLYYEFLTGKTRILFLWILEGQNALQHVVNQDSKILAGAETDMLNNKIIFLKINILKTQQNNQIKKMVKDLIGYLNKQDIQIANKHIKRCSPSRPQGNANENINDLPLHTYSKGPNPETDKTKRW